MFKPIYDILVEFLGDSKQGGYSSDVTQYQFACPRCVEEKGEHEKNKFNLECNLSRGVFQCWSCANVDDTMRGRLSKLIKEYGGKELYIRYKNEIKTLREAHFYELDDLSSGDTSTLITDVADSYVRLPKTFKKINIKTCNDKRLLEYVNKRKLSQELIDKFNIGYTTWDEEDYSMRNRIIIPSYDSYGDLNYYLGRDYTGKSHLKYKNCTADKKEIIFQESLINWDNTIYLCEGSFDAMRFPSNGVSMLGKSLTKDSLLYRKLYEKSNGEIVVALDGDTNEIETKKIYKLLDSGRLRGRIRYIDLWNRDDYKDMSEIFENLGKNGVLDVLHNIKQYHETDLIF